MRIDEHLAFRANRHGRIEAFDDGSLLFLCDQWRMLDLNETGKELFACLDGTRTVGDIAGEIATSSGESYRRTLTDVAEFIDELEKTGAVRRQVALSFAKGDVMADTTYLVNPDVSFRQEEDGGILYNADTDGLEILNPSGVAIWQFLYQPHTRSEVVAHLMSLYEDAEEDGIEADVAGFMDNLTKKGYIGTVEEAGAS